MSLYHQGIWLQWCAVWYTSGSVRRNKLLGKTATRNEIENVVKLWLRYARDRGGGREKRQLLQHQKKTKHTLDVEESDSVSEL